jgi:hypothetical protein
MMADVSAAIESRPSGRLSGFCPSRHEACHHKWRRYIEFSL